MPRKSHGSPVNPEPLALGGLGLNPHGLSLVEMEIGKWMSALESSWELGASVG